MTINNNKNNNNNNNISEQTLPLCACVQSKKDKKTLIRPDTSKIYREMLERFKTKVTAILSPAILSKTFLPIGNRMIWFSHYTKLKSEKKKKKKNRSSFNATSPEN